MEFESNGNKQSWAIYFLVDLIKTFKGEVAGNEYKFFLDMMEKLARFVWHMPTVLPKGWDVPDGGGRLSLSLGEN